MKVLIRGCVNVGNRLDFVFRPSQCTVYRLLYEVPRYVLSFTCTDATYCIIRHDCHVPYNPLPLCGCLAVQRGRVGVCLYCATEAFACCVGMVLLRGSYLPPHTDVVLSSRRAPKLRILEWPTYSEVHHGRSFVHSCLWTFCYDSAQQSVSGTRAINTELMVIFSVIYLHRMKDTMLSHYIMALLHCCPSPSRAVVCPRIWVIFGDMEVRQ